MTDGINGFGFSPLASFDAVSATFAGARERIRQLPPLVDKTEAFVSFPFDQVRSISKPPRARRPVTDPASHSSGSAGSKLISPPWLCNNISVIPAVAPKLPSILKGGWGSNKIGYVPPPFIGSFFFH